MASSTSEGDIAGASNAEISQQSSESTAIGKRPLGADETACETPTKQAKKAQGKAKAQSRSSQKTRHVLPEPEKPKPPPSAFSLFCKQKWPVLVGEDKDRLEQAKLMWKALPSNDRAKLEAGATHLAEQYNRDIEVYELAVDNWKKSLPAAERAALKQKDKELQKSIALQAKQQALEDKQKAKEYKEALKNIGDEIKGSLQICKRRGMWEVPDGAVNFSGISLGLFRYIFGSYGSRMSPQNFTSETASVVGQLTGADAGRIFGVTKIRGGSMYATFTIQRITVSYQPKFKKLTLAYQMDGF